MAERIERLLAVASEKKATYFHPLLSHTEVKEAAHQAVQALAAKDAEIAALRERMGKLLARFLACHGELETIAHSRSTNFVTVNELVVANRAFLRTEAPAQVEGGES
jgi:histidinol-phosphate/aromatic aminotransferase/cobyric acid decarboxylase-like protein